MAIEREITAAAHPSIYKPTNRNFKIIFCEPEKGINQDTGILLLNPGLGGNSNSNIYKKMRKEFADQYNLITVQCDFFGFEFLQNVDYFLDNDKINFFLKDKIVTAQLLRKELVEAKNQGLKEILLQGELINLKEQPEYCCDFCIMQALDNISAVLTIMFLLKDNGIEFNENKIILYGTSHGSYLSYVCNAFAPFLFSTLIDVSFYLYPTWLESREFESSCFKEDINILIKFRVTLNYIITKLFNDLEVFSLPTLYSNFNNSCKIISFHGSDDELTSLDKKQSFCDIVNNCELEVISQTHIDKGLFKAKIHNSEVDLIKLFNYVMGRPDIEWKKELIMPKQIKLSTQIYDYIFDYANFVPRLKLIPRMPK